MEHGRSLENTFGRWASGIPLWILAAVLFVAAVILESVERLPYGIHEVVVIGFLTAPLLYFGHLVNLQFSFKKGVKIAAFGAITTLFGAAISGAVVAEEFVEGTVFSDPFAFVITGGYVGALVGIPVGMEYVELLKSDRLHQRESERISMLATRLSVKDRVLRHNLRTDTNIILGNTKALAEQVTKEQKRTHVQPIIDSVENLISLSNDASRIQRLFRLQPDGGAAVLNLQDVLGYVRRDPSVRDNQITIETLSSPCHVNAHPSLDQALIRLLTILHSDTDSSSQITLVTTEREETVDLNISFQGQKLPEAAQIPLLGKEESELEHWDDLSLWYVYWAIKLSEGEIHIDEGANPATISIELAKADSK